jgi:hypothetical protein
VNDFAIFHEVVSGRLVGFYPSLPSGYRERDGRDCACGAKYIVTEECDWYGGGERHGYESCDVAGKHIFRKSP